MLIKVVAQAIPSYVMSLFSFTKDFCNTIQVTKIDSGGDINMRIVSYIVGKFETLSK